MMIKVRRISLRKGGRQILKAVSFSIEPGKVTVLMGKNGAGKSTLLEVLAGEQAPDAGQMSWDGVPHDQINLQEQAQKRAVLSQKVHLPFPMQVQELVGMGTYPVYRQFTHQERRQLITNALEKVQLSDFCERDYTSLSGGEQARALLAKCLVQLEATARPGRQQYLLMDEPTASLDIEQQYKLIALVQRLAAERSIGVLAILHDLNLAAQLADQVLFLRDGQLTASGRPEQVFTEAILHQAFDLNCIVQRHPLLDLPHIIPLTSTIQVSC